LANRQSRRAKAFEFPRRMIENSLPEAEAK
jgi:hypothetical protein